MIMGAELCKCCDIFDLTTGDLNDCPNAGLDPCYD